MNKDTNIRIDKEDLSKLRELAEKQSRTIKATLKIILKYYLEENE
jgi:predicted DNA-binding protein